MLFTLNGGNDQIKFSLLRLLSLSVNVPLLLTLLAARTDRTDPKELVGEFAWLGVDPMLLYDMLPGKHQYQIKSLVHSDKYQIVEANGWNNHFHIRHVYGSFILIDDDTDTDTDSEWLEWNCLWIFTFTISCTDNVNILRKSPWYQNRCYPVWMSCYSRSALYTWDSYRFLFLMDLKGFKCVLYLFWWWGCGRAFLSARSETIWGRWSFLQPSDPGSFPGTFPHRTQPTWIRLMKYRDDLTWYNLRGWKSAWWRDARYFF